MVNPYFRLENIDLGDLHKKVLVDEVGRFLGQQNKPPTMYEIY